MSQSETVIVRTPEPPAPEPPPAAEVAEVAAATIAATTEAINQGIDLGRQAASQDNNLTAEVSELRASVNSLADQVSNLGASVTELRATVEMELTPADPDNDDGELNPAASEETINGAEVVQIETETVTAAATESTPAPKRAPGGPRKLFRRMLLNT